MFSLIYRISGPVKRGRAPLFSFFGHFSLAAWRAGRAGGLTGAGETAQFVLLCGKG